jgi:hypothetical protein
MLSFYALCSKYVSQGKVPSHSEILRAFLMFALYGLYIVFWSGVRLSPLGTSATIWPILPAPSDR